MADDEDPAGESSDKREKQRSFWKELPVLIGVALVLALVIKAFAVQAFYIPSESMRGTLEVDDRVLVNKIGYRVHGIHRGDIVVFNGLDSWTPEATGRRPANPVARTLHWIGGLVGLAPGETDFIKRVIGVGGDRISCTGHGAPVMVNGRPLDERPYLRAAPETRQRAVPSEEPFDVVVPKGRLWVMGDNRGNSYDSRGHQGDPGGGSIPEDRVVGRAFVVIWPLTRWDYLSGPATFTRSGPASAALPATPLALGFAGAVPLVLRRRASPPKPSRRRHRKRN